MCANGVAVRWPGGIFGMTTSTTRPSTSTLSRSAGRFSISLLSDVKQALTSSTPTSLLGSYCKVDTSGLDNNIAPTSLGDLARSRQRHSPVAQPSHSPRSGTRRTLDSAPRRSTVFITRHARGLGALQVALLAGRPSSPSVTLGNSARFRQRHTPTGSRRLACVVSLPGSSSPVASLPGSSSSASATRHSPCSGTHRSLFSVARHSLLSAACHSPHLRTNFAWMTRRDIKETKTQATFVEADSSLGDYTHWIH
jgi:hypothetical protein